MHEEERRRAGTSWAAARWHDAFQTLGPHMVHDSRPLKDNLGKQALLVALQNR